MTRPQIPSREVVKELCARNGPRSNGLAYSNQIWIKYGENVTLAEATIQEFVHNNADSRIVYTLAFYDWFSVAQPGGAPNMTYIVMEKV